MEVFGKLKTYAILKDKMEGTTEGWNKSWCLGYK